MTYDDYIINSKELYHYGILGMRWGVRRTYEQIHGTKPRYIKKGTSMYRVSTNEDENLKGYKYVTYVRPDRDKYRGWYADSIREQSGKGPNVKIYEQKFKLKEDLKIPSRNTLKDVYKTIIDRDPELRHEVTESYFKTMYKWFPDTMKYSNISDLTFDQRVSKSVNDFLGTYGKETLDSVFCVTVHGLPTAPKFMNAAIKELKAMGYNAMTDENSIGGSYGFMRSGYDPIIIFDGNASLEKRKSRNISTFEQTIADMNYQDWFNSANRFYKNKQW